LTADALVRTAEGTVRIGDIVPGAAPSSEHDIDLKVHDRNGDLVRASKFFHSGEHETLRLRTREGYELTGTRNHPVLCLVNVAGVPTLLWKLLEEIQPGDRVVMQRVVPDEIGYPAHEAVEAAILAGAFVSEGWISTNRAGFNNVDREYFFRVLAAYDLAVGGSRYVSGRVIASGRTLHELDVHNLDALRRSILGEMVGQRSAAKRVPEFVWRAAPAVKRAFLQSLFEGDGRRCLPARPSRFRTRPVAPASHARYSSCCWSSAWCPRCAGTTTARPRWSSPTGATPGSSPRQSGSSAASRPSWKLISTRSRSKAGR
jgi:DNA gyrase subunit A